MTRELDISLRFFSFSGGVAVDADVALVPFDVVAVAAAAAVAAAVDCSCLAVLLLLLLVLRRKGLMLRKLLDEFNVCRGVKEVALCLSDLKLNKNNETIIWFYFLVSI